MLTEIFILLSLVLLESIAEYELKKASIMRKHYSYLLFGILFYGFVALFFYFYLFFFSEFIFCKNKCSAIDHSVGLE